MNKSFYERAKELANNCIRVKDNHVYETLSKEFNIGVRVAGDRFKSLFGKSIRDYISEINTPTKEILRDAIIQCNNQEELLKYLNIHYDWIRGLYDKYFNVSTFRAAKLKLFNEMDYIEYNPSSVDNLSILISQHLGDGCIEINDRRSSLRIEHGSKQFDYLKLKVNLLKKAFPSLPGLEAIKKRISKNGYESFRWSCTLRNSYMNIIKNTSKEELIRQLSPLGWMLWYLDDGSLSISKNSSTLEIAIHEDSLRRVSVEELKTYGFTFHNYNNRISISSKLEIIKFLNCFVKPFIHLIPECMKYKCYYKDIVEY